MEGVLIDAGKNTNKLLFRAVMAVPRGITGIPLRSKAKLNYADIVDLSLSTATNVVYSFNSNSLFKPDYANAGHQPRYFDQYAALYNRYIVTRVDIDVTFNNNDTTDPVFVNLHGAIGAPTTSAGTTAELPFHSPTKRASGYQNPTLKLSLDLVKMAGVTRQTYISDDRFQALVTASPSELMTCGIYVTSASNGNISATCSAFVILTYHCEFFERPLVGSS